MNIALASTACGQILTLFKFVFGYPESEESKERNKQLEELECHFVVEEEPPADEDTISKAGDEKEAATQFDDNNNNNNNNNKSVLPWQPKRKDLPLT